MTRVQLPRPILAGIAAVAVLDIVEPILFYGVTRGTPPLRIFQSVASGVLGRDAYTAGWAAGLLGAAIHVFIAAVVVLVFWQASRRMTALAERPLLHGVLYGLGVYAVMNFIVIPLSAIGGGVRVPPLPALLNGIFAHAVCVGLPAALAARATLAADARARPRRSWQG